MAARVALLEAKLSLLNDESALPLASPTSAPSASSRTGAKQSSNKRGLREGDEPEWTPQQEDDFLTLPDREIQRHIIDMYFEHNHNQPYSYFQETTFRRKFDDDCLPEYLMLAFVATACRFSDHEFYHGRQTEAMTAYANASWHQIYEDSFSQDGNLEFSMVQATSLLAAIEFTCE